MFNRSINKVILIGNLGKDPEMRYMPNGNAVANLAIATTESWKDKQTGERKDKTEWHRLTVFNRLGEMCGEYLKKGAKIYVEGKLQTRKWQGQDGQDRFTTEVVVDEIQMMDSRNPAQGQGQFQANSAAQNSAPQQSWGNAPQNSAPAQQAAPQMAPAYQQAPARQAPAPQQQAKPVQPQKAPAQYNEPSMDFDDDIPF
ncbi:single-stranded DNA-binding protein [Psychromonas antarctica]|jgi:single-strand DNA-binding protein|uniref:single-stranded DNA-binding protein n=1 Tax=Psychromonas antarctica TaxID=67573 RepID=UPI001EE92F5A|nr:single-stranded DNA-binding protein [Psychromonas antarctica]MCG6200540.1 single-stranded DNA-binding protein [Psychromonas antarctica]